MGKAHGRKQGGSQRRPRGREGRGGLGGNRCMTRNPAPRGQRPSGSGQHCLRSQSAPAAERRVYSPGTSPCHLLLQPPLLPLGHPYHGCWPSKAFAHTLPSAWRSSTFHGYVLISQSQLTGWLRERPRADTRGPVSTRPHLLCSQHVLLRASVSTWPLARIFALGRWGLTLLCPQGWVSGVAHPRWSAMFADGPLERQQTGPGERPGPLCKGSWASTWVGWM